MQKQTLQQIFNEIGNLTENDYGMNDKGGKIHTYLETYDRLFKPFREGCDMMEIGLAQGDSIRLWDRYFEKSLIVGVDLSIVFEPPKSDINDIKLIEADATTQDFLDKIKYYQAFNIIIDDSSHVTGEQVSVFNMLKSRMVKGSIYIIEDLLALDIEREKYLALHDNVEIIDMRSNGRFDNALCVIRF